MTAQTIVARVTDSSGVGVGGATVAWSVVSGGGSFLPVVTTADANGIVGTSFRLTDRPGPVRVRATFGSALAQDFAIKAVPGPLAQLTPLYTDLTLPGGSAFSATVRAIDLYGNGIPGLVLTSRPGDIQYTNLTTQPTEPPSQTTDSTGAATFGGTTVALPGLQSFLIEGPVTTGFPSSFFSWVRVHATGDRGYITPATNQGFSLTVTRGATIEIDVVVIQADGTPATLAPVTFSVAAGNGSIVDATGTAVSSLITMTDKNSGLASARWHLPASSGTYTIAASTPAPNDGRSPLTITAVTQ